MKAVNLSNNHVLVEKLECAESILARMTGLLGKKSIPTGSGLLIKPCKGIHTFGMRFGIDAIFLSKKNEVLAIIKNMPRNRMTRIYFGSESVLELPAGTVDNTATKIGDLVEIK